MLAIGRARYKISIQAPTVILDSMGAPKVTWAAIEDAYAELENEMVEQAEATATGARRELSKTVTFIIRCHPEQTFTPAMRVIADDGSTYEILAARYNYRKTTAYLDCRSGYNAGGIP